jgi:hypothetical protein
MRKQELVLRGTVCPFVVSFAFKPRTNLGMNVVHLLSAKVRDLTAMIVQLNPGKRFKINSCDSGI